MDIFSHATAGGLVALVGLQKKFGTIASATMVAASILPDADSALAALGPKYFFQFHRHPLTHSIAGAILLSLLLTGVVYLATPLKRPGLIFGISMAGTMLHLGSDLLTPWPMQVFYPFSSRKYSLDLVYFLEPFLLAALAAGFLVTAFRPAWAMPTLLVTVLVVGGYLGLRANDKRLAMEIARQSVPAATIVALPYGLNPLLWDVISDGKGYTAQVVDVRRRRLVESRVFPSADEEPGAVLSKRSPLVQAFLRRARFPVVTVGREDGRSRVEWQDVHLVLSGGAARGVTVVLDEQGHIIEERLEMNRR